MQSSKLSLLVVVAIAVFVVVLPLSTPSPSPFASSVPLSVVPSSSPSSFELFPAPHPVPASNPSLEGRPLVLVWLTDLQDGGRNASTPLLH